MESEHSHKTEAPKEVSEQSSPATPDLSTRGQMNISASLPPEPSETPPAPVTTDQPLPALKTPATPTADAQTPPAQTVETREKSGENPLPRPDNPETKEVSGSKEIGLGRDDGQATATNDSVDDPTTAGHRRIQEALKPTDISSQPADSISQPQPTDPAVAPSGNTDLTPVSPSIPADNSTLPPAGPPLRTDTSDPSENQLSDDPIVFKTDYSTKDLGGAANEINAENADINKANRELFEARAEAKRIEAETGLSIDEYRRQAGFRLEHPEWYGSTDPQEILNSSIPVSPSLPTAEKISSTDNLPDPSSDTVAPPSNGPLPTDSTTSLPPVSPPLTEDSTTIPPVSPSLPVENVTSQPINADVTALETLPDGRYAVISGNPEMKKQFTHPQGTSTLEYITPDGDPLKYEGTCGIVSCEDVAKQQGIDATEDDLVRLAAEKNLCVNEALDSGQLGGTTDANRAEILDQLGIPNEIISAASLEELAGYIENNQSAIAAVNAGFLWNDANYFGDGMANHAIVVTGIARDPQSGEILGLFINDSGTGEAGKFISSNQFKNAWLNRGGRLNVTLPSK